MKSVKKPNVKMIIIVLVVSVIIAIGLFFLLRKSKHGGGSKTSTQLYQAGWKTSKGLPWKIPTSYYVAYEDSKFDGSIGDSSNIVGPVVSGVDNNPTFTTQAVPSGLILLVYRSVNGGSYSLMNPQPTINSDGSFTDTDNPFKIPDGGAITFTAFQTEKKKCFPTPCRPWKVVTNYAMLYKDQNTGISGSIGPTLVLPVSETDNNPKFSVPPTPEGYTAVLLRTTGTDPITEKSLLTIAVAPDNTFIDIQNPYGGPTKTSLACKSFAGGGSCNSPPAPSCPKDNQLMGPDGKCISWTDDPPGIDFSKPYMTGYGYGRQGWDLPSCPMNFSKNRSSNECGVGCDPNGTGVYCHTELTADKDGYYPVTNTPCDLNETIDMTGPTQMSSAHQSHVCMKWSKCDTPCVSPQVCNPFGKCVNT
jgi:hypothetical protein